MTDYRISAKDPRMNADLARRLLLTLVAFAAILVALTLVWIARARPAAESHNALLLGSAAPAGTLTIPIARPMALSGLSTTEIIGTRSNLLAGQPVQLARPYHPSPAVFGGLRDGLGWMSLEALFITGPGPKADEGLAAESRNLLNPLLLLGAEFWGLSIWDKKHLVWNMTDVDRAGADTVPLYPRVKLLKYSPQARLVQATWGVTSFLEQVKPFLAAPLSVDHVDFGVVGYNARDLGFSWVALRLEESQQVINPEQPAAPVRINDSLGDRGDLCGTSRGCNHSNMLLLEFDSLRVTALPAKAVFWLWGEEPVGEKAGEPELRFEMIFE